MLRRLVLALVGQPRALSAVAADTGMDLKRLHHHVTRLCGLGLVKVAGEQRRAGRALKLYQAAADAFFVPYEAAPELFSEALSRELRGSVRQEAMRSGAGMLFNLDAEGRPRARALADPDSRPKAAEFWQVLRLEPAEADALRADLATLLERHAGSASGRGKPYLVHAALARRSGPTVTVDNRPPPRRDG